MKRTERNRRRTIALNISQFERATACVDVLDGRPLTHAERIQVMRDWLNREHRLGRQWQARKMRTK